MVQANLEHLHIVVCGDEAVFSYNLSKGGIVSC
jgi:hypothetical protein